MRDAVVPSATKKKAHLDECIEFGFGVDSLPQLRHRLVVASGEEGMRGGVSQSLSPRSARRGQAGVLVNVSLVHLEDGRQSDEGVTHVNLVAVAHLVDS